MKPALAALFLSPLLIAAPAFAQETNELPRFEALQQQEQAFEQRRVDNLETQRQRELDRMAAPNSGFTGADRAIRDLEYARERDRIILQGELEREQVARQRQLENTALPNRRIAPYSSLVVTNPEQYILPPAPPGQYYARLNGRFVLVDRTSELVVKVLEPQPTDPTADVPLGPRPPPRPGLPTARIGASSDYVILNPTSLSLPPAPQGQFYATYEGRILLVDLQTERAVKVMER
ncbi:MAG: RcnB family protein [Hyphomonadaceae bacterium]|nr:RcnB family protein [Hyphomonadaceae bacterium]